MKAKSKSEVNVGKELQEEDVVVLYKGGEGVAEAGGRIAGDA